MKELLQKYTNEQSRFLVINGTLLHYRIEGEGEPILLLHGSFSSLHTFDAWAEMLSKQYRVVRLDIVGFGLTGPNSENRYDMEHHLFYLKTFVDALGIKEFYLGGSSLGGWLAWEFTLRYPSYVRKLILLGAAGFLEPNNIPLPFKMARTPLFGRVIKYVVQRNILEQFVREVYYNQDKVTEPLITRYYDLFTREGNPEAFLIMVNEKFKDNTKSLKQINIPTLILWGREDKWIPVQNARRFHDAIPHNRMLIYERVGHLPMEEIPLQTGKALFKFLQEKD
ncbi:alpha/beta fold hydrolase [Hugenholtzia roseola]|uniref:alpha/beta fold hydrolase n=1 Tax=Hugenholtzia roseola TaxID=1002 RepID=UPI000412FE36|nr:alpha/beta hydrolase [Hugenholtzia roseola]